MHSSLTQFQFPRFRARLLCAAALSLAVFCAALRAQVPQLLNYQGRVAVSGLNFSGAGSFKFALVNTNGSTTYWSNDGTSSAGAEPTTAVALTVNNGLYSVLLGDTSLANMTALPASVWTNADVRLRIWFNDGVHGSQLLAPDQRLAPNGYLPDGAVSTSKIATGAVTSSQLGPNAVQAANIAAGSIGSAQLAAGAIAPPVGVTGSTQAAAANTAYSALGSANTTFALPATANVGDRVQITGAGAGGWLAASGVIWTARSGSPAPAAVASSSDGTHLAAAVSGGQIFTSADSGATWTPQGGSPTQSWTAIASSADGTHLVAASASGSVSYSINSGVTWTAGSGVPTSSWRGLACSSDGTHQIVVATTGVPSISTDSGAHWTAQGNGIPANASMNSVASSADGTHLVAVGNGVAYVSGNSGASWSTISVGSGTLGSVACSADGSHLVTVSVTGPIFTSTDFGLSWTSQTSPSTGWAAVASSADGTHLAAAPQSSGQVYLSMDSGVTWTSQRSTPVATYTSVASSSEGLHLIASPSSSVIYTAAPAAIATGAQGSTGTLQYLGNGQWSAVAESQIATGAVGTTQLAASAVQAGNIASGAVGSTQLAPGLTLGGTTSGAFSGNGAALTGLNASNITTGTIPAAQLPSTVVLTTPAQTLTNKTIATASNTLSYARSGAGMAARTLNAETDETPITSLAASAALNGNSGSPTDDTAALQRALDTKGLVRFSAGASEITGPLNLSTIGQLVTGAGVPTLGGYGSLIRQFNAGQNGFDWFTSSDALPFQGPGTYYLSLHSFGLEAINHNTGTGLALGNSPIHSGDYLDLQNIYLFGWETGLHITSMAMARLWNVTIEGDSANPTDYGIVLDGGSENSHIFAGVSAGNCTTGLYLNTTSQGNVYMLGDFGMNGTHVLENVAGANGVYIGGNFEGYTNRIFNLHGDSNNVIIEPGYNLAGAPNEPYLLNGNKLIFVGHTGAFGDGSVMQFKGEGHISLSPSTGIDTLGALYPIQWHQTVFPSVYDTGIPAASASNRGVVFQKVARSGMGTGDSFPFMRKDSSDNMVVDDLANGVMLEQPNTWQRVQTFGNTNGGIKVQSSLQVPPGSPNEEGALVIYGDPSDVASGAMIIKQQTSGQSSIDITAKNHDGSVSNETVSFYTDHTAFLKPPTLPAYTVATLPAGHRGDIAYVTDSSTSMAFGLGLAPQGGGSNVVPVFYDGTGWKVW